jgi:ubiquitin-protein ligase
MLRLNALARRRVMCHPSAPFDLAGYKKLRKSMPKHGTRAPQRKVMPKRDRHGAPAPLQSSLTAIQRQLRGVQMCEEADKFSVTVDERDNVTLFHALEEHGALFARDAQVLLEMRFPPDFPRLPPFVRVCYPRFKFHTAHVTIGGSICLKELTPQHWDPNVTMPGLLLQLHSLFLNSNAQIVNKAGDFHHPFPERWYDAAEAKAAFDRVARDHGWA